jgi:hypothetical protein
MTWISLICLLALSSSAFARSAYGGDYEGAPIPEMTRFLNPIRDQIIERPLLPTRPVATQGYGQSQDTEWSTPLVQQDVLQMRPLFPSGSGSQLIVPTLPKNLPVRGFDQISQGFGVVPRILQFDQPAQVPIVQTLTPADLLCRGHRPETMLAVEDGRKFVVCTGDSKGVEQDCPKGLFFHEPSRRCERKIGPVNQCASEPCRNGGQCVQTDSTYQCQCPPGFDGQHCELDGRACQAQPCGQSPDVRCQSFRPNAALQYICIFQDGLAYGLNPQQVQPSPCQVNDGPHALAVSDKGFIMCDSDRMFIESCPGGTIWDDLNKACSWPDIQGSLQQLDQSQGFGQSPYGEQRTIITKPTYGGQLNIRQFDQPKFVQPYSTKITAPLFEKPRIMHLHRAHMAIPRPQFDQPKPFHQYGGQFDQPKPLQSYGGQITIQKPAIDQPNLLSSYGGQQPQHDLFLTKKLSDY